MALRDQRPRSNFTSGTNPFVRSSCCMMQTHRMTSYLEAFPSASSAIRLCQLVQAVQSTKAACTALPADLKAGSQSWWRFEIGSGLQSRLISASGSPSIKFISAVARTYFPNTENGFGTGAVPACWSSRPSIVWMRTCGSVWSTQATKAIKLQVTHLIHINSSCNTVGKSSACRCKL